MTKLGFSACLHLPSLGVLLQHYSFQLVGGSWGTGLLMEMCVAMKSQQKSQAEEPSCVS